MLRIFNKSKYQFKIITYSHIFYRNALDSVVSPETELLNASPLKIEHKTAYKHLKTPNKATKDVTSVVCTKYLQVIYNLRIT